MHLDIKPENIYCVDNGVKVYKIGDFGLLSNAGIKRDLEEGDCRYLPKELLNEEQISDVTKADIFSLGCSVYELVLIFYLLEFVDKFQAIRKPLPKSGDEWNQIRDGDLPLPPCFSKEFQMILKQMMHSDPEQRPSADQLLQHPLLLSKDRRKKLKLQDKNSDLKNQNQDLKLQIAQLQAQLQFLQNSTQELKQEKENLQHTIFGIFKNFQGPT